MTKCVPLLLLLLLPLASDAQLPPIGQWREHHSWNNAFRVAGSRSAIWCATESSVFFIDLEENTVHPLGKTSGLSSTGIVEAAWDDFSSTFLIGYRNGIIDLVQEDEVTPVYALANAFQGQGITIHDITSSKGNAYLSTGLGVVIIDLLKQEVKETCVIGSSGGKIPVYSVALVNDTIYAATSEGLKCASLSRSNLADFRSWKKTAIPTLNDNTGITRIAAWRNWLLIENKDTLWSWNGASSSRIFAAEGRINHFSVWEETVIVSSQKNERGSITVLNKTGNIETVIENEFWTNAPADVYRSGNTFWIADQQSGLSRFSSNTFTGYSPQGPEQNNTGQMLFSAGTLWAAPYDFLSSRTSPGRKGQPSQFSEDKWGNASDLPDSSWNTLTDIHCLVYDEKENTLWGGSMRGGIFSLQGKKELKIFNAGTPLQAADPLTREYRIGGLALDKSGNLWITNDGAFNNLHGRSREGNWTSFRIPFATQGNAAGRLAIDPSGQKWIQLPDAQGLACFNDGNTRNNPNDDRWRLFRSGKGLGNLPDNDVLCMAIDKNDLLWIGTGKGVGVIQCTESIFSGNGCEAVLPVVQQDNFAGYLFKDQQVQSIAIDGANRKWFGTKNGAWLLSADGDSTLFRFDIENSPLPENDIREISIHPRTGEVFFATPGGTVSFRSTATEATEQTTGLQIFPNPVPPEYTGMIGMRGLKENTIVKITTMDGRLVFETRALGGQAIWDGRDAKGQKVASGIYLVVSAEGPKNGRSVGKIILIGK